MNIYDSYRDTGIAWIGKIPCHWEIIKVKFRYSFITGFTPSTGNSLYYDSNGYNWVTIGDLSNEALEDTQDKISDFYIKQYKPLISPQGSLLYSFKLSVGTVALIEKDVYTNEAIASFLPNNRVNLKFLKYSSYLILHNANINIYGAPIMNQELIKNASIIFPPLDEQEAIADYLDRKCASIDGIIATQERRIALLNELKQSIITEAVTRGINPDAPLRDSGIDWIGQIPEHWEVMRFKNIMSLKTTPSISENKIGLENIESGSGKFIEMDNEFDGNGVEFEEGDILYGKLRPYLKKVWLAEFGGNAIGDFFVFRHTKKSVNRYLKYLMLSQLFTSQANGATNGAKMPRVSSNFILTLKVAVPSIEEQPEIVDFIETKILPLDSAIAKAKREIELLKEYKQSVITEAVTGKIKVC